MDELRDRIDVLVHDAIVRYLALSLVVPSQPTAKRVPFTQADVARAVKGARARRLKIGWAEIETGGRIVVYKAGTAAKRDTSWDDLS
ncbi:MULTISPECIES: hypothetical protein [unclassified Sphingomonas]|uniref:hypothetical protein n=1 Tax=unclassified Sphingomonas TaxID=196159 RepID=UPI00226A65BC|nr:MULTISPECIES: hypothetical protein [unclassified Sphingomonas]